MFEFFTGAIVALFESLRHQKYVGRDGKRCVVMKPAPAPSLVMSESQEPLAKLRAKPTAICLRQIST